MNKSSKFSLFLALAFAFSQLSHGALWTAGHGDLGIAYEDGELEPPWHLGEDNESVTLDGVAGALGPDGEEYSAADITPVTTLTQNIGGSFYYVFPVAEVPSVPFIGFGTEELSPSDWLGDIVLTLTGVSGPGDFSLFSVDALGATSTLMSSADGVTSSDSIPLQPDDHAHHLWAFSTAGDYDLTFQVDGNHSSDGAQTASATYGFTALAPVPELSTAGLLLGAAALVFTVVRRRAS